MAGIRAPALYIDRTEPSCHTALATGPRVFAPHMAGLALCVVACPLPAARAVTLSLGLLLVRNVPMREW